jgi:hypothetical protein
VANGGIEEILGFVIVLQAAEEAGCGVAFGVRTGALAYGLRSVRIVNSPIKGLNI